MNLRYRFSYVTADYAIRTNEGKIVYHGLTMTGTVTPLGPLDYLIEGKQFTAPLVETIPELKGDITIMGDIDDSADIRASGNVQVNGKHMMALKPDQRLDVISQTLLTELLFCNNHGYENMLLFKSLIHTIDINKMSLFAPLPYVARNGHLKYLRYLLDMKANLDIKIGFDESALHTALKEGHLLAAELLIEAGIEIRSITLRGETVIDCAEKGQCKQEFLELLKRKMLEKCRISKDGESLPSLELALRRAASDGKIDIVYVLLNFIGNVDVNQPGIGSGRTALHLAVIYNRLEVAKQLIKFGARKDIKDNIHQKTAENYAQETLREDMQALFFNVHIKPSDPDSSVLKFSNYPLNPNVPESNASATHTKIQNL